MLGNLASLRFFVPELILSAAVLAVLVLDLIAGRPRLARSATLTIGALVLAAIATVATRDPARPIGLFGGLFAHDPFADFFRLLSLAAAAIAALASLRARDAVDFTDGRESAEYFALLLATTLGLCLMASACDLLSTYLAIETVSIGSYLLSGYRRRSRASSEASLKFVIYGGVASGVMLYGMSFLYGIAASTRFCDIRVACLNPQVAPLVVVAVVLCLAGFGFKIASVPFHQWCPDVYQGAPTPVTAFFAVGPKAAGMALLVRFFESAVRVDAAAPAWPVVLIAVAAATLTLGNLTALVQSNVKRLLAYSSIAHAGYLLFGLCANTPEGVRAILLHLVTYLLMAVGVFEVITAVEDAGVGNELLDWRGLGQRAPAAAAAMTVFLFSLTGIPPLAGFFGKYFLFASLIAHGGRAHLLLALIGVLNTALALVIYARIVRTMYFDAPPEGSSKLALRPLHAILMWSLAAPTVTLFLAWQPIMGFVEASLTAWLPSAGH